MMMSNTFKKKETNTFLFSNGKNVDIEKHDRLVAKWFHFAPPKCVQKLSCKLQQIQYVQEGPLRKAIHFPLNGRKTNFLFV